MKEINIGLIKPNPKNPRTISADKFEKLKKSIQDFPAMLKLRPLVVDEKNIVLGGNMRLKALQELGYKKVWVERADKLTKEQKKEFITKDNIGYGEWDWDVLVKDWDVKELEGWGLDFIEEIDFDNIESNELRQSAAQSKEVTCPECGHKFLS